VAAATRFSVPRGWANITSDNAALAYDVGLVHLDGQPFSSQLAPYLTIAAAPDSFFTSRTGLATAGYPGDKPPGTMWGTSTYDYFVGADTVYTQLDVNFGQSGSPIYTFTNPPSSGYVISVVSYGNSTYNGSIRFTASWLAAMRQWCAEMGCTFATGTIAEPVYTMSGAAFCKSSPACAAGAEPLVAGQPIRLGFRISPNPTQQVHADLLWNGTQFSQVQWDLPYSAGGTFYVDPEIRLPAGASSGTLTARVWVGSDDRGIHGSVRPEHYSEPDGDGHPQGRGVSGTGRLSGCGAGPKRAPRHAVRSLVPATVQRPLSSVCVERPAIGAVTPPCPRPLW
jgi:hypothetical protein